MGIGMLQTGPPRGDVGKCGILGQRKVVCFFVRSHSMGMLHAGPPGGEGGLGEHIFLAVRNKTNTCVIGSPSLGMLYRAFTVMLYMKL